jgi:hypothetical protein
LTAPLKLTKLIEDYACTDLGADLYDAGFLNITNIDISTVVINQMTDLHRTKEEMECTRRNQQSIICFLSLCLVTH